VALFALSACAVPDADKSATAAANVSDQAPTGSHLHRAAGTGPSNVTSVTSVNNVPLNPTSGQ
jgi:hypothetical protein